MHRNGDDHGGRCVLKVASHPDTVTKPSPNFYGGTAPGYVPSPPSPAASTWCETVSWPFGGTCKPGCPCPARVIIGKGLGWEIGWAAHRERWTRLIAVHRWLGAAHHVEKEALCKLVPCVLLSAVLLAAALRTPRVGTDFLTCS